MKYSRLDPLLFLGFRLNVDKQRVTRVFFFSYANWGLASDEISVRRENGFAIGTLTDQIIVSEFAVTELTRPLAVIT